MAGGNIKPAAGGDSNTSSFTNDDTVHIVPLKGGSSSSLQNDSSPMTMGNHQAVSKSSKRTVSYSYSPSGSERSSDSVTIPSLHGSLMRSQKQRDPHRFYEVIKVLGDGSMGSVSKVQKRKSAVGGSARSDFVEKEERRKLCFGLFTPFFTIFCPPDTEEEECSKDLLLPIDEHHSENSETLPDGAKRAKDFQKHRSGSSSIIAYGGHKEVTYALKSIHLDRVKDSIFKQELINEVAILQRLDHPHIVRAIETFDYNDRLYLVLELCSGGDLYARDPYDEAQVCRIVHSVVDAVAYMHSKDITHRDLKFENIMFANPGSFSVKIIDFGLSKKYASTEHLHDAVGTVYTMAPEVLKGDYDNKVDVWSIGVIAFMLLSSSLPFYGKTRSHVVKKILEGKYSFKGRRWNFVSQRAKEFVMNLLSKRPERRPSAEEALQMSWLNRHLEAEAPISFAVMDHVQATIQTFAEYGRLKKLALLVVAYKSTDDEIGFLRKIFKKFDMTHDGEVEMHEFKKALEVYHYTDEELERMFMGMDIDGTGKVHYVEFLAATIEAHGSISEERIAEAFDRLDSDDSGYITVENLEDILGDEISKDYVHAIIDEADIVRDHQISYKEFLALWDENYDSKLKHALKEVNNRRISFDDAASADSSRPRSVSEEMETQSTVSTGSSELGGGNYFFGVEKQKSIRGVWV